MRMLFVALTLGLLALFVSSCDSGSPAPAATPTPTMPKATATAQATPLATPASSSSINITAADYDAALARWKAAAADDYTMVVSSDMGYSDTSGQWTLRVRGGKIVEISRGATKIYVDTDNRAIPNPEINPDSLGYLTVESQFAAIKKLLDDPNSRTLMVSGSTYNVEYDIKFNDALGYPELFAAYPVNITDNSHIISILSFQPTGQGPDPVPTATPASGSTPAAIDASRPAPMPEVIIEKGSEASQKAYDAALARWHASGIQEYEETLKVSGEGVEQTWTLHVNGSDVTVVSSTEGPDAKPSDIKGLWVDDQFAEMARVLAGDDSAGVEMEGQQFFVTYVVNFDANYSYPVRYELRVKPGPIMDLGFVIEVESFKVIRKANS